MSVRRTASTQSSNRTARPCLFWICERRRRAIFSSRSRRRYRRFLSSLSEPRALNHSAKPSNQASMRPKICRSTAADCRRLFPVGLTTCAFCKKIATFGSTRWCHSCPSRRGPSNLPQNGVNHLCHLCVSLEFSADSTTSKPSSPAWSRVLLMPPASAG